ncbi:MAG TPA: electron transfer flavoprotein subunit alpha/FixB family protein [Dehalococcoidia bacterium]|nr:electron transfer flavoprotein subunit alpha/FixB family protein [Dehalococcoidia bacterium]
MAEFKGVMVCGETVEGKLSSITTELLGCGRRLADELKEGLLCILIGNQLGEIPQKAIASGADKVYTADDPLLKEYQTDSYIAVMEKVIKDVSPQILLLGQTAIGRDLAPRLAFRLGVSLSMDCLELNIDPDTKLLQQTRPVYGGNARAIFTAESFPQMITVRQKAMSPLEPDESRKGEIVPIKVDLDPAKIRTKVIETVKEEIAGIKLEDAEVIVTGGRGIGSAEGFKQLEELAKILKGAVGASRPPCDNGWVPDTIQVGLTGKIVTPELYIAVAISGASQHLAGCSSSKNIIAINRDAEANIFKEARFGVVGDWKQVLPAFTEEVKKLLAG